MTIEEARHALDIATEAFRAADERCLEHYQRSLRGEARSTPENDNAVRDDLALRNRLRYQMWERMREHAEAKYAKGAA